MVLIDDEPIIIEGLKKILDWHALGFEIVAVAYDGVDGFSKLLELNPDVALIDIRIPGIDGLLLIQRLREKNISTKIIILSGYSEFEYARKAVELGVESYLLKPIDKQLLEEKLMAIREKLEEEFKINRAFSTAKKLTREKVVEKLVLGTLKDTEIEYMNKFFELQLPWKKYQVAIIQLLNENRNSCEINQTVLQLKEKVDLFLNKNSCGFSTIINNNICILFKDFWYPFNSRSINILKDMLMQYTDGQVIISIGSKVEDYRNIKKSFEEANELLKKRFLLGYKGLIFIKEAIFRYDKTEKEFDDNVNAYALAVAIEFNNFEKINNILENKADNLIKKNASEDEAKSSFYNFFVDVLYKLSQNQEYKQIVEKYLTQEIFKNLFTQKTLTELKGLIKYYFTLIAEQIKKLHSDNFKVQVEEFIKRNYFIDLKLETLAEIFGYNSSYFSKLFKKTFGENFLSYIEKVRIEKAKELLENGEKVSKVAKKVGYEDMDYFCLKFKKYVGCSPKGYKESLKRK
ncbi:response regulator transcription factor [Caldicellulosiruptor kronotskyensis]|uniref:response regulator transcription factor n=1 Tax=Caldicellulosiruptor kronotskyensis TaxID=413889 RepID=UPI001ED8F365|nr:response regulator [Caldicellulosiruptor kronotskyensis]